MPRALCAGCRDAAGTVCGTVEGRGELGGSPEGRGGGGCARAVGSRGHRSGKARAQWRRGRTRWSAGKPKKEVVAYAGEAEPREPNPNPRRGSDTMLEEKRKRGWG